MPKWTRRGVLASIFGLPLAYWSGFWREMGVKPLVYQPLVPNQAQIYMNWLFEEHLRNVQRAFMGMEFDPRPFEEEDLDG